MLSKYPHLVQFSIAMLVFRLASWKACQAYAWLPVLEYWPNLLGLNGFALYREIRRLDKKVKICFLTAGELYCGYSDIFSSLPANYFIRKPIDNEELMKRINEIITDDN